MKKDEFKRPVARQLPSGAWRCRVRMNGEDISIVKPTRKEAEAEAMAVKYGVIEARKQSSSKNVTLEQALNNYIEVRKTSGALSPSTIYGYEKYKNVCFQEMMDTNVYTTTDTQWQAAIRRQSKGKSPKYVANAWGLVSAAIFEETRRRPDVKLPAKEQNKRPYLTAEQVKVFVEAVKGDPVEIPALMELTSMRRSEMLAVTWNDVDMAKRIIRVRGSMLETSDGLQYRKQNKTNASTRTVPIIPPLFEALEKAPHTSEYVVTMKITTIKNRIDKICRNAGLPEVGNHGLRHSFASLAYHLGIPEKTAMEIGGWSDFGTMRKIYTHISQDDIAERAEQFSNFFQEKNDHENDHEK